MAALQCGLTDVQAIIAAIDQGTAVISGFIAALIFAVTWKG